MLKLLQSFLFTVLLDVISLRTPLKAFQRLESVVFMAAETVKDSK